MCRTDTLQKAMPVRGSQSVDELKNIAVRYEEKIYAEAADQVCFFCSSISNFLFVSSLWIAYSILSLSYFTTIKILVCFNAFSLIINTVRLYLHLLVTTLQGMEIMSHKIYISYNMNFLFCIEEDFNLTPSRSFEHVLCHCNQVPSLVSHVIKCMNLDFKLKALSTLSSH